MSTISWRGFISSGLLLAIAGLCLAFLWPFLAAIGWSLVLTVIIWPLHSRLERRLRRPSLAAGISTAIVLIAIVLPAVLLGARLVHEARQFARITTPGTIRNGAGMRISAAPALKKALDWASNWVDLPEIDPDSAIREAVAAIGASLGRHAVQMIKNVTWAFFQGMVLAITLFFMLRDGRRARTVFRECVPLSADETDELITNISSAISATVFGNGVVAIVQGALAGLAYWAIGLPSPLLWTLVTTLLCLVPILGAPVIWGPAALFLAIGGEYGRAIGLVLWGLLVVGTIDNVLRPILIGSRTKMHPLPVFFAAVGGTFVMGPLGLFMGPAILSSFGVLLQMHRNRRSDSASASIAA